MFASDTYTLMAYRGRRKPIKQTTLTLHIGNYIATVPRLIVGYCLIPELYVLGTFSSGGFPVTRYTPMGDCPSN